LATKVGLAVDSPLEGDGFELPVPRELGLRRGRRLALHLGSLALPDSPVEGDGFELPVSREKARYPIGAQLILLWLKPRV
jgi:hypothetical protein